MSKRGKSEGIWRPPAPGRVMGWWLRGLLWCWKGNYRSKNGSFNYYRSIIYYRGSPPLEERDLIRCAAWISRCENVPKRRGWERVRVKAEDEKPGIKPWWLNPLDLQEGKKNNATGWRNRRCLSGGNPTEGKGDHGEQRGGDAISTKASWQQSFGMQGRQNQRHAPWAVPREKNLGAWRRGTGTTMEPGMPGAPQRRFGEEVAGHLLLLKLLGGLEKQTFQMQSTQSKWKTLGEMSLAWKAAALSTFAIWGLWIAPLQNVWTEI